MEHFMIGFISFVISCALIVLGYQIGCNRTNDKILKDSERNVRALLSFMNADDLRMLLNVISERKNKMRD